MSETEAVDKAGVEQAAAASAEAAGIRLELSPAQRQARDEFRRFAAEHIAPHAAEWERQEAIPGSIIEELRRRRWLAAILAEEDGALGLDPITYGLLTAEIGRACSSVRSLLTVHDMVAVATRRWGSRQLRSELLPRLVRGEALGAFALSEPETGSDARHVRTQARSDGDDYVLDGTKRWITFGQIAHVFLVMAQCGDAPTAFLVPADASGFSRRPIRGIMGTAASMLAELSFDGCRVPKENLVGREGFGFSHVMGTGLDHGRYSVAWGAVGLAEACLEASLAYTSSREQFGNPLDKHQLVRRKLTEMIARTRAARLLCYRAGYLRQIGDLGAVRETMLAKYYASRAATAAAADAVQLHGANGVSPDYPVARYLRDSRVLEIIEGSSQIHQITIPTSPPEEL